MRKVDQKLNPPLVNRHPLFQQPEQWATFEKVTENISVNGCPCQIKAFGFLQQYLRIADRIGSMIRP